MTDAALPANSRGHGDPAEQARRLPLSALQRQFLDRSLIMESALVVRTRASAELILQAVRDVFQRHDAMRTTVDVAQGSQSVSPPEGDCVRCAFVDRLDAPEAIVQAADAIHGEVRYEALPWARFTLGYDRQGRFVMQLASHHVLADLVSMQVLVREITAALNGVHLSVPRQFSAHLADHMRIANAEATWRPGAIGARALQHWAAVLDGAHEPQILLGGSSSSPQGERRPLRRIVAMVPKVLASMVEALARELRLSRFHVYLVAYALAIARLTRSGDVSTVALIHGRPQAAAQGVVGLLLDDIVIRHQLAGKSIRGAIRESASQAMTAYRYHPLTGADIAQRSAQMKAFRRERRKRRLVFQYRPQEVGTGAHWPGGEEARRVPGTSLVERWILPGSFLLSVDDFGGNVSIEALFDPGEFVPESVQGFCEFFVDACREVVTSPDRHPIA